MSERIPDALPPIAPPAGPERKPVDVRAVFDGAKSRLGASRDGCDELERIAWDELEIASAAVAELIDKHGRLLSIVRSHEAQIIRMADERVELIGALREIEAINIEDDGTFRKRGGTRRGLSLVAARTALDRVQGGAK